MKMQVLAAFLPLVVSAPSFAAEDPAADAVNRLPARVFTVPCETEQLAIDIKQMDAPKSASRWVISLDGTWDFRWEPPTTVPQRGSQPAEGCACGNPVGLCTTTFRRPWRWWFRRTILRFEGMPAAFRVRVNGEDVGCSGDDGLPVEFDLTDRLKVFGRNTLEVEVRRRCDGACPGDRDFRCLSGAFRGVYLVSERKDAPFDVVVETRLSDDLKSGKFIVRDEKGDVLKERDVPEVRLWSPESPFLYMTPIENKWGWWIFGGTDYRAVTFGFRKVESRDSVLCINGRRVLVKGTNLHETDPATGCAVTQKRMLKDIRLMKSFNFNAVRIRHHPVAPDWYDLCDREGIMVCCETNGGFGARLMRTCRNHPSLCPSVPAGFAGDFADWAVWKTDARTAERGETAEGRKWLAYDGGLGDEPDGGGFGRNGFFDALRNPRPRAYETKHANQSIHCESFDFRSGKVKVRNGFLFTSLGDYCCCWRSFTADGAPLMKGTFEPGEVAPGAAVEITLENFIGDIVTFNFYGDTDCCAWDSFARPFVPRKVKVQAEGEQRNGENPLFTFTSNLHLNFWRAPTDNDRGWKMPEVCKVWKDATESQKPPAGVKSELKASKLADGSLLVDWTLTVPKGLPPIPRVGLTFTVPKTNKIEYFGLGPWENYADRATGAMIGVYTASIGLVSGLADPKTGTIGYPRDRLNPDNYAEPGEQGYRTGCRRLKVGGVTVEAVNAPFGFNVWPYPQTMLEGKKHQWEMSEADVLTVNIDAVQMGVGGDNSWGARPHDRYMPGAGTYRLVFTVRGLK